MWRACAGLFQGNNSRVGAASVPEDPPGDGFCYLEGLLEEQECRGNDYPDTCECYQKNGAGELSVVM